MLIGRKGSAGLRVFSSAISIAPVFIVSIFIVSILIALILIAAIFPMIFPATIG
jgi:hypothetical protein